MTGKFYSVGIGLGSDYLTLAAKHTLEAADIIAVPAKNADEKSTAFELIKNAADIADKEIITLEFPMSRNINSRKLSRQSAVNAVAVLLDEGKTVAMITLGDVAVYSTCSYVLKELKSRGYKTETVSGIPSFCAAAACAGVSLCEGNETLAVVPAVNMDGDFDKMLDTFDNIVVMKAGKNINKIYDALKIRGLQDNAVVTSRVNMDGEIIGKIAPDGEYGYFTTVIIKKNGLN